MAPTRHSFLYPLLICPLLLSITCALPSYPFPILQLPNITIPTTTTTTTTNLSLSIPHATTPLHAGRTLECFPPGTPKTQSVDIDDCEFVLEAILREPAGAMNMHTFSHTPKEGEWEVPAFWGIGGCVVVVTAGDDSASDSFPLVDVIIKAQEIIAECPGKSKTHLGGMALIGHGKTFFVAVNGPHVDPDASGAPALGLGGLGRGIGAVVRGGGARGRENGRLKGVGPGGGDVV